VQRGPCRTEGREGPETASAAAETASAAASEAGLRAPRVRWTMRTSAEARARGYYALYARNLAGGAWGGWKAVDALRLQATVQLTKLLAACPYDAEQLVMAALRVLLALLVTLFERLFPRGRVQPVESCERARSSSLTPT